MSIVTQKNRSWWALVAFCTTTALVAAFSLAILIASASVAFAVGHSAQSEPPNPSNIESRSFSGVVTDSHCGARHQDSTKSPAECTKMCVRNGAGYILVDGDKSYALSGDGSQFGEFAGQRVAISGTLDGSTLRVDSIHAQQ